MTPEGDGVGDSQLLPNRQILERQLTVRANR
jgi:hypothetical protein